MGVVALGSVAVPRAAAWAGDASAPDSRAMTPRCAVVTAEIGVVPKAPLSSSLPATAAGTGASRTVASTTVVAHVPAIVNVQVDGDGAVVAVSTNTGFAPGAGDQFTVWVSDTDQKPASSCVRLVALSLATQTGADWSRSGEWHRV